LEGRLAESDVEARRWVQRQVVAGTSPSVAGTVSGTFADTHPDGLPWSMAAWVGTLLRTPHTDAAARLVQLLLRTPLRDTESLEEMTRTAVDRMIVAADQHEDSGLHRSLLNLVVELDKVRPMGESGVLAVYGTVRSRLLDPGQASNDRGAALRDLSTLSGTLMAEHLDTETVRNLIGDVLIDAKLAGLGKKLILKVTSLLFSILRRDPDAPTWLLSVFAIAETALEVKLAIAEALLQFEGNMPGGYAGALKERPDCPPEVAALIVRKLQS